jgi:ferritin
MTRLATASEWEQELFDRFNAHVENERELLSEYRELARELPSEGFRYLAEMIVADEERHHATFAELANAIAAMAELSTDSAIPSIPVVGLAPGDRERVLDATERFLYHEREDSKHLAKLMKELKPVRDTTLWSLLVELMQADTHKHIKILEFIRDRVKHPLV